MEENNSVIAVKHVHWARLAWVRQLQRVCPYLKVCEEKACRFGPYCQCVGDEERASTILENRLWGIVTACAVAAIVCCLLTR